MDSLQVQELSFEKAREFQPDEVLLKKMRESAFQEGIKLEGTSDVLGVELRDRLLQLNSLTRSSLDK